MSKTNVLVTGTAGFIGYHLTARLVKSGMNVVGIDNINEYYQTELKLGRLRELGIDPMVMKWGKALVSHPYLTFYYSDLLDQETLESIVKAHNIDTIVHLAAYAGVRTSLGKPRLYQENNVLGFQSVLDVAKENKIKHVIYASSSSVYGNSSVPYIETARTATPLSVYAATKLMNELMAFTYSHLYGLPCTGLRLFTVYGAWGRPDMAYYKFASRMLRDECIELHENGEMLRDFTYIDDVVHSVERLMDVVPGTGVDPWSGCPETTPHRVVNVGNNTPEPVSKLCGILENALGRLGKYHILPAQPGEVHNTWSDTTLLRKLIGKTPSTTLETGIPEFAQWYLTEGLKYEK